MNDEELYIGKRVRVLDRIWDEHVWCSGGTQSPKQLVGYIELLPKDGEYNGHLMIEGYSHWWAADEVKNAPDDRTEVRGLPEGPHFENLHDELAATSSKARRQKEAWDRRRAEECFLNLVVQCRKAAACGESKIPLQEELLSEDLKAILTKHKLRIVPNRSGFSSDNPRAPKHFIEWKVEK